MRILIVTDAWVPQVNGVVRTLRSTAAALEGFGHEVARISPEQFRSLPCPTYPEIRLALASARAVGARIEAARPDAIHIATEGPLGLAARRWCLGRGLRFTTAYHTRFPEYVARRTGLPADWFWRYIRWFHRPAAAILAATPTLARELAQRGLPQCRPWGRGVDLARFRADAPRHPAFAGLARPIQLYVGRIAVEKNIEAFLEAPVPGAKVVVGDGPACAALRRRFPSARFVGAFHGDELASAYASADVLVFPSRTDTFGLVMIEALACGTPVAAFPVPGPADILNEEVGALRADLAVAIAAALTRSRAACAAHARAFSWEASARQFEAALVPLATEPRAHPRRAFQKEAEADLREGAAEAPEDVHSRPSLAGA
jgi:glycosyltransferase involved in cell wall biosynthesis